MMGGYVKLGLEIRSEALVLRDAVTFHRLEVELRQHYHWRNKTQLAAGGFSYLSILFPIFRWFKTQFAFWPRHCCKFIPSKKTRAFDQVRLHLRKIECFTTPTFKEILTTPCD